MKVWIPGPDQTSEKPSASSTCPFQPVPAPWTKPSHSAPASVSFMPGPQELAAVLHRGGGDLVREPHPLELLLGLDRPRAREQRRRVGDVRPKAWNQSCVKVVGSPTIRSDACVPSESSSPIVP